MIEVLMNTLSLLHCYHYSLPESVEQAHPDGVCKFR